MLNLEDEKTRWDKFIDCTILAFFIFSISYFFYDIHRARVDLDTIANVYEVVIDENTD